MQNQKQKRYLAYLLLVATFALSAASASSQERKAPPADEKLPQVKGCPGNIVANGDFTNGLVAGPMGGGGAVSNWTAAYGTPDVSAGMGCHDPGVVGMWGNQNSSIGEGLQQTLTTVPGNFYVGSICFRRNYDPNKLPSAGLRVRASSGPKSFWGTADTILQPAFTTTTSWGSYNFSFTAAGNITYLTINVEGNSNVNHGTKTSYGQVDDICITCRPLDADFTLNATLAGSSPTYSLNATSTPLPAGASFWWRVEEIDASGNVVAGTTMTNPSAWWSNPTYNNFSGYCCNNVSSPAGVFQQGHKYRISRGVWSPCNPWKAVSKTVFMCSNCRTRGIQIEDVPTIQTRPNAVDQ